MTTFPTISASDWRAAMHRGRTERNVVMERIQAKLYESGGVESRHAESGATDGKYIAHNPGRRGFGSDSPQGTTGIASAGVASGPLSPLSAQKKAAGFQPAAKQIQKRIK